MINGLEGLMGGGKSYEAVRYHLLPALQKGRKVITNLPLVMEAWEQMFPELVHLIEIRTEAKPVLGRWDAEAANRGEQAFKVGEFEPEERLRLVDGKPYLSPPKSKAPFSGVWCFYDTWRGPKGIGPLFIIDECHVSFPKPKPMLGISTPQEVVQYFKLSRHFGVDMLLATQRFKSVEEEISGLIQIHHRVMKAHAFGDKNSYIKKTLNGYRGEQVSVTTRKYGGFYHTLYRSHTQGQEVQEADAEDVTPFIKKWRYGTRAFIAFTFLFFVYAFWPTSKPKTPEGIQKFVKDIEKTPPGYYLEYDQKGNPVHVSPQEKQSQLAAAEQAKAQPAVPEKTAEKPPAKAPEKSFDGPLDGKQVHLSGSALFRGETIYTFEIANGGQRILTLTSADLKEAGYSYKHLAHCMGMLKWRDGKESPVICDAPRLASGTDSTPVVLRDTSRTAPALTGDAAPQVQAPDYPHPLTAAAKTAQLVKAGSL